MNVRSRLRDVLIMIVFALATMAIAFAGYALARAAQDARAIHSQPTR